MRQPLKTLLSKTNYNKNKLRDSLLKMSKSFQIIKMYFVKTQDNLCLYLKTYHASTCCIKCSHYNVYIYYVFNICILCHEYYLQNDKYRF